LPRVEQAWAIEHLEEGAKRHNRNTIRGIANILKDYPGLRCTVHGETGRANSVPLRLADHLRLHPTADLHQCMEVLARRRAEACLEALVAEGVPREQLLISSKGMGGQAKVDFIPEGYVPGDSRGEGGARGVPTEVVRMFEQYDRDRSGDLDVGELKAALSKLGLPSDTSGAAQVFDKFDANRSGRLELEEFYRLVEQLRAFNGQTDPMADPKSGQ